MIRPDGPKLDCEFGMLDIDFALHILDLESSGGIEWLSVWYSNPAEKSHLHCWPGADILNPCLYVRCDPISKVPETAFDLAQHYDRAKHRSELFGMVAGSLGKLRNMLASRLMDLALSLEVGEEGAHRDTYSYDEADYRDDKAYYLDPSHSALYNHLSVHGRSPTCVVGSV